MTDDLVPTCTELTSVYGVDGELARGWLLTRRCMFTSHHLLYLAGTPAAQERYAWLSDGFQEHFGCRPALFARAPGNFDMDLSCALRVSVLMHRAWCIGRVNLIGEHIDYEGYAVLPMAIRQVCSGCCLSSHNCYNFLAAFVLLYTQLLCLIP